MGDAMRDEDEDEREEKEEVREVPAWAAQNYTNKTVTVDRRKTVAYVMLPNHAITQQVKVAIRPLGFDGPTKRWVVDNKDLPMLEMMVEEAGYKVIISEVAWKDRLEVVVQEMEKVLSKARALLDAPDM